MTEEFVLTPETFLRVLGLSEIERELRSPGDRELLFEATVDLARDSGLIVGGLSEVSVSTSLDFRIPGTGIVVRLSRWEQGELTGAITAAAMVIGTSNMDPKALTAVGIVALSTRISRLKVEHGERSIVEVLPKADRPTGAAITMLLHGNPCRHPESGCRFRDTDGGHCTINRSQVEETARHLVERGVLRIKNAVDPQEYAIVL
ncbi:hypothetical protein AB0L25_10840 [Spirillospora sp. NPDC052242]